MSIQLRPHLKAFPIAIFFSLLLRKLIATDIFVATDTLNTGFFSACFSNYNDTISNKTGRADVDKYQATIQSLLNNLNSASAATSSAFHNTTAGKPPNKSYGAYLCRGDATSSLCRSCVANLTNWAISTLDPETNCTESVAYADYCMVRYASYSFFGKADDHAVGYMFGKSAKTKSYNRTIESVVERVISDAAYNSAKLFATSEADVDDEHETVYALAQCTPDIDRGGCSGCLKAARDYMQYNLSGDAKAAWGMYRSCQLRYDNVSFYGVSPAAPSNLASSTPVSGFLVVTWSLLFVNWMLC